MGARLRGENIFFIEKPFYPKKFRGEDAAHGHGLAVSPGVAGDPLDGVGVGVPVVEDLPGPRLGGVDTDRKSTR